MQKVQYDMIYLAACGVNQRKPDAGYLQKVDMECLYRLCCIHQVEALIGISIKQAGETLSQEWNERVGKAFVKIFYLMRNVPRFCNSWNKMQSGICR